MTYRSAHSAVLPALLANAAAFHLLHTVIFNLEDPSGDVTGLLVWWGCLALTYCALARYLRQERPIQGLITLCSVGFAVQLAVTLLLGVRYPSVSGWFSALLLWGYLYYRACILLCGPVRPEQLTLSLEGSAAALVVNAFLVAVGAMASVTLLPAAAGMLLALFALSSLRTARARRGSIGAQSPKGRLVLFLLLAGCAGLAVGAAALFTAPAALALTRAVQGIRAAAAAFSRMVEAVMRWLAALFPQEDLTDPELELGGGMSMDASGADETLPIDGDALLYVVIALVAAALAVILIVALRRGGRSSRTVSVRTGGVRRGGLSLRTQLALLWQRLTRRIRFQIAYWRGRNSAPGLLVWLERGFHRQSGESARAFLGRVAVLCPEQAAGLADLADRLDAHYFGPGQTMPAGAVAELRRQLRKQRAQAEKRTPKKD